MLGEHKWVILRKRRGNSLPLVIGIWSQLDSGACWDIFAGAVSRAKVTLTGSLIRAMAIGTESRR